MLRAPGLPPRRDPSLYLCGNGLLVRTISQKEATFRMTRQQVANTVEKRPLLAIGPAAEAINAI